MSVRRTVPAVQLAAIIGNKVRALRERDGLTQDDVARAARAMGLPWKRAAVTHLEGGTKKLSAEELLLLPFVVFEVFGELWNLADLTGPDDGEPVDLTDETRIAPDNLAKLLSGRIGDASSPDTPQNRQFLAQFKPGRRKVKLYGLPMPEVLEARREAQGDAERKAARRFGVEAMDVAVAAHKTWRRGLTAERDARLADLADAGADVRSVQALRGHVTRTLLAELKPVIQTEEV
jgi:transcriptional regulator with XRE-family HTH domain